MAALRGALKHLPPNRAGVRIFGIEGLQAYLSAKGSVGSVAAGVLGPACRPVRAVLFDKTAKTNWSLGWHQDRTICVRRKIETGGFGPWTMKGGIPHVAPPFNLLAQMVTLRVHLDDVPATNAPLLISPGSHTEGRVPEDEVENVVRRRGIRPCIAEAGDVWLYATPILHASKAAADPRRRRVLQVDFAAGRLPGDLQWLGV